MTDQHTIQLDAKTRAYRDGDRWAVAKVLPGGAYNTVATWDGPRRSIFRWCDDNKVVMSREAERQMNALPERKSFREDEPQ